MAVETVRRTMQAQAKLIKHRLRKRDGGRERGTDREKERVGVGDGEAARGCPAVSGVQSSKLCDDFNGPFGAGIPSALASGQTLSELCYCHCNCCCHSHSSSLLLSHSVPSTSSSTLSTTTTVKDTSNMSTIAHCSRASRTPAISRLLSSCLRRGH